MWRVVLFEELPHRTVGRIRNSCQQRRRNEYSDNDSGENAMVRWAPLHESGRATTVPERRGGFQRGSFD
jgi:hypothetical protein